MKPSSCCCLAVVLVLSGVALAAAPAPAPATAPVKVTRVPTTLQTRTFDRKHPPAQMPRLTGNEAAVTVPAFSCEVRLQVEDSPRSAQKPTVTVVAMDITVRLDITMWLPKGVTAKLKAHEEGHRQISEKFYEKADSIAKSVAQKYIGRTIDVDGRDHAAVDAEMKRTINEFCGEYMGGVSVPASRVNDAYDHITEHGTNRISEAEAIRRAMKHQSGD
jgi:hypothetical protein